MRAAALIAGLVACLAATTAQAGSLVLRNTSDAPITCTVDGWTKGSGGAVDRRIEVPPGRIVYVDPNEGRAGAKAIRWAECGGLRARAFSLTAASPDHRLVLTGQQKRVLNVSLYAWLPTLPGDRFEGLVAHIVEIFQAQHPDVLLNAVLDDQINSYNFAALPKLLGPDGFDVMEQDVLFLGFLASHHLINPARLTGEAPWPVAIGGATVDGQLWAVPSWLCMNFIYSDDPAVQQHPLLPQLAAFLAGAPAGRPKLSGAIDGDWTMLTDYVNAYVHTHGPDALPKAETFPPDPAVVRNLAILAGECLQDGKNKCTDGLYHDAPDGTADEAFATGRASADMGFSEQSFYMRLYAPAKPLYVVPATLGDKKQPLLYEDSFVTSKATCAPGSPCASDADAFIAMMTGVAMKNYIVQSRDLPPGSPWRTLLVANRGFWDQKEIAENEFYRQLRPVFDTAKPFPNDFTPEHQSRMSAAICAAVKAQQADVNCTTEKADLPP